MEHCERPALEDRAQRLRDELHRLAAAISLPSLCETIRLLDSGDAFEALSCAEVREVASYRPIELGGEPFYRRAFTPGKEAAASLAFAQYLGREVVLDDLRALLASLGEAAEPLAGGSASGRTPRARGERVTGAD